MRSVLRFVMARAAREILERGAVFCGFKPPRIWRSRGWQDALGRATAGAGRQVRASRSLGAVKLATCVEPAWCIMLHMHMRTEKKAENNSRLRTADCRGCCGDDNKEEV